VVSVSQVYELLDAVYAAAEDPALWPAALAQMSTIFCVCGVNLWFNAEGRHPNGVMVNHGIDPEVVRLYNEHYVAVDPLVTASLGLPPGTLVDSEEMFSARWWRRHKLYGELGAPFGIEHIGGATLLVSPTAFAAFSMMRAPGASFSGDELALLEMLIPHMMRAFAIHHRLGAAEQRSRLLGGLVDRLDLGVVLVDDHGRVLQANEAALAIARQRDGFVLGRGTFAAAERRQTAALLGLVANVLRDGVAAAGGALRLSRPSGRRPLEVLVVPLSSRQRETEGPPPVAALFITDPEVEPRTAEDLLQQLYGLTPAEARLAVALLVGLSVDEAADRFTVTAATVRTQLRSVFAKTDTRRQSELVRTLLRSPVGGAVGAAESGRTPTA